MSPTVVRTDRPRPLADRPLMVGLAGVAAIVLIVILDVLTGPELAFSLFYALPVLLVSWAWRIPGAVGSAVVAAVAWRSADALAGAEYSADWIKFWNTGIRLGFFLLIGGLTARLRTIHDEQGRMARLDGLTGLPNASTFLADVESEVARSRRFGHPIALAYVDLDDFKEINDTQGHRGGDEALRRVARLLEHGTRSTDRIGRLGGDEFAALFVETDEEGALVAARKLHQALGAADGLGASVGLVTCAEPAPSADALIAAADDAMYEAKHQGKGRLCHRRITDGGPGRDGKS